jgi:CheY-like chemotaxis protein
MKKTNILLVEDNEGDILLTTEALNECEINYELSIVSDGAEATDFMQKTGNHINATTPDLVLLDLNLPKKNGHEVCEFIKSTADLKHIPVIMLTTSSAETDITKAYQKGINCYVVKPVTLDEFMITIGKIVKFWSRIVVLPTLYSLQS